MMELGAEGILSPRLPPATGCALGPIRSRRLQARVTFASSFRVPCLCGKTAVVGVTKENEENGVRSTLSAINRFFSMLCGWLMLALMILLVFDFAGRGVPGALRRLGESLGLPFLSTLADASWLQPSTILADLSVFIMITAVYLGLALCEENGQHVSIEIIPTMFKGKLRQFFIFLSFLLQEITVVIMIYAMYRNTLRSYRTEEAVAGLIPLEIWPIKVFVCVGLLFYLLQLTSEFTDKTRVLFDPELTK
jgi:TRAP-type mannitol/chloroaromatic compound transport system permease small subunit